MIASMHFGRLELLRTGCMASAPPSCHRIASVCTPAPPASTPKPEPLYPNVLDGKTPGPFGDRSAFSHRDNCAQF